MALEGPGPGGGTTSERGRGSVSRWALGDWRGFGALGASPALSALGDHRLYEVLCITCVYLVDLALSLAKSQPWSL